MRTIELARRTVAAIEARVRQLEDQARAIAVEMKTLNDSRAEWMDAIASDEAATSKAE